MALNTTLDSFVHSPSPSASSFQNSSSLTTADDIFSSESEGYQCFICHNEIIECSESRKGDAAIFCEGSHKQWAHARCAQVNDELYKALTNSSDLWYCPMCKKDSQDLTFEGLISQAGGANSSIAPTYIANGKGVPTVTAPLSHEE